MRQQEFVGSAIGASNPTRELLKDATTIFGKDQRVAQILSIGAGVPRVISLESSSGSVEVNQLLQTLATDCEVVARELSTRLFTVDAYLRLNIDKGMEDISMTDWGSLGGIESHTSVYVESSIVGEVLETSLGHLRSKIGSITLGQLSAYILDLIYECGIDVFYRSLKQHQDCGEGSTSRLTLLRHEKNSVGLDGPPPYHIFTFISPDLSHYGDGRVWQNANGLVFSTGISVVVGVLFISGFIS